MAELKYNTQGPFTSEHVEVKGGGGNDICSGKTLNCMSLIIIRCRGRHWELGIKTDIMKQDTCKLATGGCQIIETQQVKGVKMLANLHGWQNKPLTILSICLYHDINQISFMCTEEGFKDVNETHHTTHQTKTIILPFTTERSVKLKKEKQTKIRHKELTQTQRGTSVSEPNKHTNWNHGKFVTWFKWLIK